ncbi:MAG: hypothetical protein COC20_02975 [Cellvibrionales bacterium]|nr:MAG: hypothetical protein COC20_02975 [Cellvibrionales bacterium]
MSAISVKPKKLVTLAVSVISLMAMSACQTTKGEVANSANHPPQTINFRSDFHYAALPLPSEEEGIGKADNLTREYRLVIPINNIGQKQPADIDSYLQPLIDNIASWPMVREVKVIGHTDSEGSELSNMLLSLRRANAVADRLEYLCVEAGLLRIEAYGEEMPVGDNTTLDGRIANRRIEVVVWGYPESTEPGSQHGPLLAGSDTP